MTQPKEIWECSRCGATLTMHPNSIERVGDGKVAPGWSCDGERYWHRCDDLEHSSWPAVLKHRDCGDIMTGQTGEMDEGGQFTVTTKDEREDS